VQCWGLRFPPNAQPVRRTVRELPDGVRDPAIYLPLEGGPGKCAPAELGRAGGELGVDVWRLCPTASDRAGLCGPRLFFGNPHRRAQGRQRLAGAFQRFARTFDPGLDHLRFGTDWIMTAWCRAMSTIPTPSHSFSKKTAALTTTQWSGFWSEMRCDFSG
jgi:hypothetical protein